jgi:preprotein translocase subunit SecE
MSLVQKATNYFKEVRVETSKVSWPNRKEIRQSTIVVLITCAILAALIFVIDQVFVRLLGLLFG